MKLVQREKVGAGGEGGAGSGVRGWRQRVGGEECSDEPGAAAVSGAEPGFGAPSSCRNDLRSETAMQLGSRVLGREAPWTGILSWSHRMGPPSSPEAAGEPLLEFSPSNLGCGDNHKPGFLSCGVSATADGVCPCSRLFSVKE